MLALFVQAVMRPAVPSLPLPSLMRLSTRYTPFVPPPCMIGLTSTHAWMKTLQLDGDTAAMASCPLPLGIRPRPTVDGARRAVKDQRAMKRRRSLYGSCLLGYARFDRGRIRYGSASGGRYDDDVLVRRRERRPIRLPGTRYDRGGRARHGRAPQRLQR